MEESSEVRVEKGGGRAHDTTMTIGNWLVSISSSGRKSEIPRVEIENLLSGQIVSYKVDKKSSGALAVCSYVCVSTYLTNILVIQFVNPNVPVSLGDGTLVTAENCAELLELRHTVWRKKEESAPKEELEESEESKDMKKCLLVLSNNFSKVHPTSLL